MTGSDQPFLLAIVRKPPATPPEGQLYLTEAQTALRYGLSVRTLQDWRLRGIGPRFTVPNGRTIRYSIKALDEFEESLPVHQSTSERDDAGR